jgi:DDE family transposase
MAWCEENGCDYIFGFQGNSGLDARVADATEIMHLRHAASCSEHDKLRACDDFQHRHKSWQAARRFIARIEVSYQETKTGHLTQATDIRYCVTSLKGDPDPSVPEGLLRPRPSREPYQTAQGSARL